MEHVIKATSDTEPRYFEFGVGVYDYYTSLQTAMDAAKAEYLEHYDEDPEQFNIDCIQREDGTLLYRAEFHDEAEHYECASTFLSYDDAARVFAECDATALDIDWLDDYIKEV